MYEPQPRLLLLPVVGDRLSQDRRRKGGHFGDSPLLGDPPSFLPGFARAGSFTSRLAQCGGCRLDSDLRRRHRSRLNDLAATMSSAGAGAVLSRSGADHELRWRKLEQYDYGGE